LETCRKAGLSFDKSFYCTIVVKGSVMLNISDDALHDIRASVISGDKVQMLFHRDIHNNSIVILLGNSINDKNLARSTALLFSNLLNEEYGNNFRVGVGSFYDSIFHVDTSYEEAIRVLDHNNIFAQKNIICFSDIQKKIEQNIQYPFTLFDNLEASIQKNDIFSIQDSINQLVYFIRNKNLSLFWAKNICYDTVNTISKKLIKRYDHSPFLNKPYMERIYGKDIVTFDDIESLMKGISENVVNYLKADTESYELKLLQQIIKHIRNNYLDPDFSLQSLADSLQMSTPYLSQYFKKNTNYTISEYVTRLRMERAKDLLIKTNISVRDIAIEVGYYSVSSFIRKFREKESITPGQFKKKYS
jgi:YesN/AraC family two-component response regulator